jgi:hypothetical protein
MPIVLYKKRNKGVVGVQDKDGNTWHTKGAFEDRDAMQESKPSPVKKEAAGGEKKTP